MSFSTNIILSIKPKYANAIINGLKKVEFRKKIFKREVEKVFIYSSSPQKKIIGFFTIADIVEDEPIFLWNKHGNKGIIEKEDFFNYYKNSKTGFSICIDKVGKFINEVDPKDIFENFTPPQSYMYVDDIKASEFVLL